MTTQCNGSRAFRNLDPNEDFLLEHPIENEPVRCQRQSAKDEGLQGRPQHVQRGGSEMDAEAALDELLKKVCNQISCNRIDAHHDQWECGAAMLPDIDEPRKCGQKQEAHAAAEERPRRSPD